MLAPSSRTRRQDLGFAGLTRGPAGILRHVLFAYFDESGDSGQHKGSATYTLGGLLISADAWPDAFDKVLTFRRSLRKDYGILLSHEIKAHSLIRGGGDLKNLGLSPAQRKDVWVKHLELLHELDCVRAYAVVIQKERMQVWRDPRDVAWAFALQRLQQVTDAEKETVLIVHDEGDNAGVRGLVRKARRLNVPGSAFGVGNLGNRPIRRILDDAVPRNSKESFFVQMADLIAYSAFRTVIRPGSGAGLVCPQNMWSNLRDARWGDANRLARGAMGRSDQAGVVVWPKS